MLKTTARQTGQIKTGSYIVVVFSCREREREREFSHCIASSNRLRLLMDVNELATPPREKFSDLCTHLKL